MTDRNPPNTPPGVFQEAGPDTPRTNEIIVEGHTQDDVYRLLHHARTLERELNAVQSETALRERARAQPDQAAYWNRLADETRAPSDDKKDDDGQTDEKGRPITYWGGAKSADADKAPAELAVALMALRRHLLATKASVSEAQLDDLEQAEHALRTVVHSAVACRAEPVEAPGIGPMQWCEPCGLYFGVGQSCPSARAPQSATAPLEDKPVAWLIVHHSGTGKQQCHVREVVLSPLTDDHHMDEGDEAWPLYLKRAATDSGSAK